jgi:hypothetical protein
LYRVKPKAAKLYCNKGLILVNLQLRDLPRSKELHQVLLCFFLMILVGYHGKYGTKRDVLKNGMPA